MKIDSISDAEIGRARQVLASHIARPLTKASALESGLFCICSEASPWDRKPGKFIYALRQASYPSDAEAQKRCSSMQVLADKNMVNKIIHEIRWRFAHNYRFDSFMDYFAHKEGEWPNEIVNADASVREKYASEKSTDKIKWMNMKTFSFWHTCLGGTQCLIEDIHVRRRLAEDFKFPIDEKYTKHRRRMARVVKLNGNTQLGLFGETYGYFKSHSQNVTSEPDAKFYLQIEEQARNYFSRDSRFLVKESMHEGKVDLALLSAILWWRGAGRGHQRQTCFYPEYEGASTLPYANPLIA